MSDKQPGSGAGRSSKGEGGKVSGETNRCQRIEPGLDYGWIGYAGCADLRDADALLEPKAFVDAEMGRTLRVVMQRYGMLSRGPPVKGGLSSPVRHMQLGNTRAGAGRMATAIDAKVGDGEIAIVKLTGKKEKISCQEQPPGDICLISFLPNRHGYDQ